jgi:hypothetical protein
MGRNIGLVIGGMVVFIVGLIIAGVVNSIASTSGNEVVINSFSGAKNINDLLPTIFYIGLLVLGLGAMGIGAAGAAGRGPTASRR